MLVDPSYGLETVSRHWLSAVPMSVYLFGKGHCLGVLGVPSIPVSERRHLVKR